MIGSIPNQFHLSSLSELPETMLEANEKMSRLKFLKSFTWEYLLKKFLFKKRVALPLTK